MQFLIPTLKRKKTPKTKLIKEDYRIYSINDINRPGRLLNFWTLRVGAYSRLGAY